MIKLEKGDPPDFLTPEKVEELTKKFLANPEARVWSDSEGLIKASLLRESFRKCVYCECPVERAGSGLDVEHHKPKSKYPQLVVEWSNLISSCKRCNTKKGVKEGVLNPFDIDPKNHILHYGYRYYGFDDLGKRTINILNLNDREKLVNVRFSIGDEINSTLDNIAVISDMVAMRNNLVELLQECQPSSEFAAIASTTLHENTVYAEIMNRIKEAEEWDDELEELHRESLKIKLNLRY